MPVTHESFCSPRPSASASPYTVYSRCRFRASVADTAFAGWRFGEFSPKWRKRFSGFRGGSEGHAIRTTYVAGTRRS